jgi:hypothetical protein
MTPERRSGIVNRNTIVQSIQATQAKRVVVPLPNVMCERRSA